MPPQRDPYASLPDVGAADPYASLPEAADIPGFQAEVSRQRAQLSAPILSRPGSGITEIQKPEPGQDWSPAEAVTAAHNVVAGPAQMLAHPIETVKSSVRLLGEAFPYTPAPGAVLPRQAPTESIRTAQSAFENPYGTIEAGLGQMLTGKYAGQVAPRLIPKGGVSRAVTDLVSKTKAENEAATAKAQTDYAKATEAHKAEAADAAHETQGRELAHRQKVESKASEIRAQRIKANREAEQAHSKTVEETKAANAAATRAQSKIPATREKLSTASQELQAQIETARASALKVGNEKYNTVHDALNEFPADGEKFTDALGQAESAFGETQNVPPLIKRLNSIREPLTYADEQKIYSELGRELSKGTLPGTTFHAYDLLQEAIGEDMQRIADSHGLGKELSDARNYWRRMKQAFGKPYNPTDVANVVREKATGRHAADEEQANRVRLLGSFDPSIPQTVEHIGNLRQGIESLPKEQPVRAVVKPLPPKPTPLSTSTAGTEAARTIPPPERVLPSDRPQLNEPAPRQIGAKEVQEAKKTELGSQARRAHNRVMWAAVTPTLFAIDQLVRFHGMSPDQMLSATGATVGMLGVSSLVTRLFRNPSFVEFMTKATPADVAAIPPELRGSFPAIVKQAQAQGFQVSPALVGAGAMGIAPRKHPSDVYAEH